MTTSTVYARLWDEPAISLSERRTSLRLLPVTHQRGTPSTWPAPSSLPHRRHPSLVVAGAAQVGLLRFTGQEGTTAFTALGALTPEHRHQLEVGSGIPADIIAEEDIRSAAGAWEVPLPHFSFKHPDPEKARRDPKKRKRGFGDGPPPLGAGIVFPLRNVHGHLTYQYKPNTPRKGRDGKVVKYESLPGCRLSLHVPLRVRPMLKDVTIPLAITEGPKKTLAAAGRGHCVIGVQGVDGWVMRVGDVSVPLPDWMEIELDGRLVLVEFDSDVSVKPSVAGARDRLRRFLESRGATVLFVKLPDGPAGEKWGIDDYIVNGGNLRALENATIIEAITAARPRLPRGVGPDDAPSCPGASCPDRERVTFLQRALLDRDDRLDVVEPIVACIDEILARPEKVYELDANGERKRDADGKILPPVRLGPSSDDKVVIIATMRGWLKALRERKGARGEKLTVSLETLERLTGIPARRVSLSVKRLANGDAASGAPFWIERHSKELTKNGDPVINPKTGRPLRVNPMEIGLHREEAAAALGLAATYDYPARVATRPQRPEPSGWGKCGKHANGMVTVCGLCPKCRMKVGEIAVSLKDFGQLRVNVENRHLLQLPLSYVTAAPVVNDDEKRHSLGPPVLDAPPPRPAFKPSVRGGDDDVDWRSRLRRQARRAATQRDAESAG